MKRTFNHFMFMIVFVCTTTIAMAQSVTGTVLDGDGQPLPGANIQEVGTSNGTTSDVDGNFTLTPESNSGSLEISFVGFETTNVRFKSGQNIGSIQLEDGEMLGSAVISGVIDVAVDRKTPVAVSTIRAQEITEKSGNTEFPDVMKSTPSVYVANQGGGYGDSKMFTRGFDQTNTAFLLNGQPINGMEDGKMYWSNWSGMTDIANAVQIQRGLGSSKLAISSVGGTINIITKATENKQGGFIQGLIGNDQYYKGTVGYSTGLADRKFATTVLFTYWQGDGFNDGNRGLGQNYFISFGYKPNDKHIFNFLITGAPQWHDQNYNKKISDYDKYGKKYNSNWGYLDGKYYSARRNYYHKPVANFNWDWNISDRSSLSTVLYASWGRGGGAGTVGRTLYTNRGLIDFDAMYAANVAGDGASKSAIRSSVNNHAWYGLVSNFNHEINDNLQFNIGADIRTYKGTHFREILDLLGAKYFQQRGNVQLGDYQITETFEPNPWKAISNFAKVGQRYSWDYDERITYGGLFGQLEYTNDKLSSYFQGAISNQSHVRWDRYGYSKEDEKSEKVNNMGYDIKAGLNYNINDAHSVYFNTGLYSRQPFHDNIYLNFGNDVNPLTSNEDIFGLEAGYKFRSAFLDANVNAYRTTWKNRVTASSQENGGVVTYFTTSGLDELHSGIEIDFSTKPTEQLSIKGYTSIGDWKYMDNARVTEYDEDRNVISENDSYYIKDAKVGGSAQFTVGGGLDYRFNRNFKVDATYNYYSSLYAEVSGTDSSFKDEDNLGTLRLPDYDLLDLGATYTWFFGDSKRLSLRGNLYNVFNATYFSNVSSNIHNGLGASNISKIDKGNYVMYGLGRTWNLSARFNF